MDDLKSYEESQVELESNSENLSRALIVHLPLGSFTSLEGMKDFNSATTTGTGGGIEGFHDPGVQSGGGVGTRGCLDPWGCGNSLFLGRPGYDATET